MNNIPTVQEMSNYRDIFEIISKRLDQQMESVDSFTTRAGLVLATSGIVFAGYTQLFSVEGWICECTKPLFVLEILSIFASGFCAFTALTYGGEKEKWRHDPDPEKLYKNKDGGEQFLQDEIMKSMISAYKHNRDLYEKKFSWLTYARYALYLSGTAFIIHLTIFFII